MEEFKVRWAGKNKFGFGDVKIDDGTNYGASYGTGKKEDPPCKKGDTITATLYKDGKYDKIKDIVVVSGGNTGSSGGGFSNPKAGMQFRSVPELNRVDALKAALEFHAPDTDIATLEVLNTASIFEAFITTGIEADAIVNLAMESGADPLEGE